ncbi:protein POOR HOMOLOGOUS SYNAPSIS 1-like [Coffea eugenioides]|uniref:protein POOR HOMOLOGOUS SYNAPSIS 1-like n=1 Tax=Coffea eugenioides TaxID=49369 RepID=UPI000F607891|nr:protein POOR HOMOLOGOUS SYNAPSIS 1-like [Coffea eugenioides]
MDPGEIQPEQQQQTLALKQQFQIDYSVFFNYTTTSSYQNSRSLLQKEKNNNNNQVDERLIPHTKKRGRSKGGAWLSSSSSSTASLFLFRYTCHSPLVLLISLAGRIQEEHFISKLHFSWPQMSCASSSRVVLASYKDSVGQIQKFAMRFVNSLESQSFIDSLKESLKEVEATGASTGNFLLGQPENECIQMDGVHQSAAEELNPICPASDVTPLVQMSVSHDVGNAVSRETLSPANNRSIDGNLPSSFTAFLNDSCTEPQEEPLNVALEDDPFSHLVKNLSASTFYVMLGKLEKFIRDTGGDLALRLS